MNKIKLWQEGIAWQSKFSHISLSYDEIIQKTDYFYHHAKKLGLIKEFKENGIL